MRFEGEEAPEQRFTGTVVGIEDADSRRWPQSKWRCLKVLWDETSTISRPERVSPWEIEPSLSPAALNPIPVPRPKRPRSNVLPVSSDSSVLTREDLAKMTVDPSPASGFPRVLQSQELSTLKGTFAESNESDSSEKPMLWPPSLDDEMIEHVSSSRRCGLDKWLPLGRPESSFTDLLSGFGSQNNLSHEFSLPSGNTAVSKRQVQEREGKFRLIGNAWSMIPSCLSLNLMDTGTKTHGQGPDASYHTQGDIRQIGGLGECSMLPDHRDGNQHVNWLMPPPNSPYLQMMPGQSRELQPNSVFAQHDTTKPKEGNCKLFGVPLISGSVPTEQDLLHMNAVIETSRVYGGMHSHQSPALASDQRSDQSKGLKMADNPVTSEEDKHFQTFHPVAREREGKGVSGSTRSCTKVHKHGTALGRSVDLAKFNNYDELTAELDNIFEFNGELKAPNKNWLVVYTDDEDDMMLVGDDPWEEFCGMKAWMLKKRRICQLLQTQAQRITNNPRLCILSI
ncbi:unnamed protein product [Fraxinus pennsylvanica]|uniref:Auxin-responsive protein n=1 Tax=Fraxinus pennsylvanica TaxID=56036 RepID=A0AAD1YNM6_9LAMI|nr:unnamed protein product [Fraxinus pennsylvanica]